MQLELIRLDGISIRNGFERKPFRHDPRFAGHWWDGQTEAPKVFISLEDAAGEEVARAQISPRSTIGAAYPSWRRPPSGCSEIDLFEVRPDRRCHGIGHAALDLLIAELAPPIIAIPLDDAAEEFWRGTVFAEYDHYDKARYGSVGPHPMPLFVYE